MIATSVQARIQTFAEYGYAPQELVTRLNRSVSNMTTVSRFVVLFFALLNPESGELSYCNAGHTPPMLARGDGTVERLSDGCLPLGMGAG